MRFMVSGPGRQGGRYPRLFPLSLVLLLVLVPAVSMAAAAGSPPGEWTEAVAHAAFSDRLLHSSVVFNDSMWVIGGQTGQYEFFSDVWRSDDGVTWTQVTPHAAFGQRAVQGSVVFDGRMWVIAGREGGTLKFKNDVWSSPDGITWTQVTAHAPFSDRTDFASVIFDNKIWVIGGNTNDGTPGNDVWYSGDGKTWTQATAHAGFSPRMMPSACVYDGKIWVTGGFNWGGVFNDVWSSPDGVTWTRVTAHAPFAARRYQHMQVADEKMWVIGGYDGKDPLSDVWYSTDGKTWTQVTGSDSFLPRWGFSTAVFDDRLWVIGGTEGNNVWHSEKFLSTPAPAGSLTFGSVLLNDPSGGIVVNKTISPVSIKQGTCAKVTITVLNAGPLPVHDIEVLDTTITEFPVIDGTRQFAFATLEPADARILTYTVQATEPGSFRLNRTTVMYADQDGNYHLAYSSYPGVNVLQPLIAETTEENPHGFLKDLLAWFQGR